MSVVGLLSWYDEEPSWLAACVASMSKFCGGIVAVDGAYLGFPGALSRPASHPVQAETILRTAEALGMACTLIVPNEPWNSEVDKRAHMFRVGRDLGDWLLWLDADELLTKAPDLGHVSLDVIEAMMWERPGGQFPIRRLFRALPDITVEFAHYVVTAVKDGRKIVLAGPGAMEADAQPFFRIEHRTSERSTDRQEKKTRYLAIATPTEQQALASALVT